MASLGEFKVWSADQIAECNQSREKIAHLANIDYGAINARITGLSTLQAWLPEGKKIGKDWVVGSLNGEAGQSLRIDIESGRWIDFESGDQGGGPDQPLCPDARHGELGGGR